MCLRDQVPTLFGLGKTSLGVEHLQGAAPYGAMEAALIDHEDWMKKSCHGGDLWRFG